MALGAALLTPADIADLQSQVAPGTADTLASLVEVWRKPRYADGTIPGGGGVDEDGYPVGDGTDNTRPDQHYAQVGEYSARITRAGVGAEPLVATQNISISPWTVTFNWADNPDIEAADKLLVKVDVWNAEEVVEIGDIRQPTESNGRAYIATTAGTTADEEPVWPLSYSDLQDNDADVLDNNVLWVQLKYLRTFEVKDPSGRTTYSVVRLVRCEEVKA